MNRRAPLGLVSVTLLAMAAACQPRPPALPPAPAVIRGAGAPAPDPAGPAGAPALTPGATVVPDPLLVPDARRPLPILLPPPLPEAERETWLRQTLDALFGATGRDSPLLPGALLSVLVVDHETGKMIYAHEPRALLNAASNVKLITAAAALSALGPEYQFRTVIYAPPAGEGRPLTGNGELNADLFVRGGGDPTLSPADLTTLAQQLAAIGIRRVRGALVIDRSLFGDQEMPPLYDSKEESAAFRAPSSATSLNGNAVAVTVAPGAAVGDAARITITPASSYLQVNGRIITAETGPAAPIIDTADGGDGRTVVTLSGRFDKNAAPRTYLRRIVHPALFLGHSLLAALEKNGIKVTDPVVRLGTVPEGARQMASHASNALAIIVHDLNKRSNNFTAEQLLRTLGAETLGGPGTWEKGMETVARYLDRAGIARGAYRLENAAGLYDSNRFSAEQIVQVIRTAMRDFRIAGEFLASLAVAGSDGTLADRMAETPAERYLRGKTGTLLGTSCLSGVVGAPGRKPLVFSILINQAADTARARAIQDQAGAALAWFLEPPGAVSAPAPAMPRL